MKELIRRIARLLVDNPANVVVTESERDQYIVLELQVEKAEIGKVIGKQGRTAQAMRTILSAAAAKVGKRSMLIIMETVESGRHARQENTETVITPGGRLIQAATRRPADRGRRYRQLRR